MPAISAASWCSVSFTTVRENAASASPLARLARRPSMMAALESCQARIQYGDVPRETLDLDHCARLLAALMRLDTAQLVIARDPSIWDSDRRDWRRCRATDLEAFAEEVARHPRLAARVLEECGIELDDFEMLAWDELDDERSYRPLMAS